MDITFSILNGQATAVVEAFCSIYGYDENALTEETKAQFAKRKIKEYIKNVVQEHERKTSAENFTPTDITIE